MCVKGNSIKVQATNNISPSTLYSWHGQVGASDFTVSNSYKGLFMNEEEGSGITSDLHS